MPSRSTSADQSSQRARVIRLADARGRQAVVLADETGIALLVDGAGDATNRLIADALKAAKRAGASGVLRGPEVAQVSPPLCCGGVHGSVTEDAVVAVVLVLDSMGFHARSRY